MDKTSWAYCISNMHINTFFNPIMWGGRDFKNYHKWKSFLFFFLEGGAKKIGARHYGSVHGSLGLKTLVLCIQWQWQIKDTKSVNKPCEAGRDEAKGNFSLTLIAGRGSNLTFNGYIFKISNLKYMKFVLNFRTYQIKKVDFRISNPAACEEILKYPGRSRVK